MSKNLYDSAQSAVKTVHEEKPMQAAVCYEFGQPLVIEDLTIDPPQTGEVKVKLAATAICHSDVHLIRGEWGGDLPVVAGHESSGIVAEVGPGVTTVQPGDHVVVSLLRSCGRCFFCQSGAPYNCNGQFALQTESRLRNQHGQTIHHGIHTASFAEYTIVEQSQCVKIPNSVPLDCAALLACGVITGLGAVTNTAKIAPRSSVAVIGVGGVGLNSVQGAALSGARLVIAVDRLENKLAAARSFGATHGVNAAQEDAVQAVRKLTGDLGVDYAFVTVGSASAVSQAFEMIRPGGTVVVVGLPRSEDTVALNIHRLINERQVIGSPMGSTRLSVDVPRLVTLYQQGKLKLDELITRRYPLAQINEAIASMERGEALRNVIVFDK
jgi:S-(hydroxymethyl)glutathione dehydrogenase / alcohol dehydrogenase